MFRVKDFKLREVFNSKGKKIGEVQDIAIDYFEGKIIGFIIPKTLFRRHNFIAIEDIISFGEKIIVRKIKHYDGLTYNDIKNLDIVDKKNNMIGVLEEILIDDKFTLKALVVSKGFLEKFKHGKHLILLKETILGEGNVLFFGNNNVAFMALPHNLWKG